jgi:molybdopterin-guanine dinucleotide biosynthesis protein A
MSAGLIDDLIIVILAGGYSRRFDYEIKALQEIENETLLARKVRMINQMGWKAIISVGSDDVREQCASSLTNNGLDLSEVSFIKDTGYDKGPMVALLNIIPLIQTKYVVVIGVDNIMISKNDVTNLLEPLVSDNETDLITVSIENNRIVSSFFGFRTDNIKNIIQSIPQVSTFERLTDLFRIVNRISILEAESEGQFINVNTPEELRELEIEKLSGANYRTLNVFEPKYFRKFGHDCVAFQREIESWSKPEVITHLKNNILQDAKEILGEAFINCKLD